MHEGYAEKWSLHPGESLRRKRGISAKEQQARAKHPLVISQDVFESPTLRSKAFHADKDCLIFCGDVREVLGWLREAGVYVDCVVTSPPFYGQRDYGVAGQIGLEQTPYEFIAKLIRPHGRSVCVEIGKRKDVSAHRRSPSHFTLGGSQGGARPPSPTEAPLWAAVRFRTLTPAGELRAWHARSDQIVNGRVKEALFKPSIWPPPCAPVQNPDLKAHPAEVFRADL